MSYKFFSKPLVLHANFMHFKAFRLVIFVAENKNISFEPRRGDTLIKWLNNQLLRF